MHLGSGLRGPNRARRPIPRAIDPTREGRRRSGVRRGGSRREEGEGESVERAVAIAGGAIEGGGEGAVKVEAGTGEATEGATVAPVEGEEAPSLAGGGARDSGLLDDCDVSGSLGGEEVGGADADDAAPAHDHPLPYRERPLTGGRRR